MKIIILSIVLIMGLTSMSLHGKSYFTKEDQNISLDSMTTSSWSLGIFGAVQGIYDSLARFGVRPDATPGYDPQYDVPRPPNPPGNYIEVYFPHSDWPVFQKYGSDITSPQHQKWVFKVETTISPSLIVLSWDILKANELPNGYVIMMRDSNAGINIFIRNQNSYSFSYSGTRTFSIWVEYEATFFDVAVGWNMISLPRIVQESSKVILFPTSKSDAFDYYENYRVQNYLQNGKGYWLKFDTHQLVSIAGIELDAIDIPLREGWNLFGTVNQTIPAPSGGIICSSIFGYDGIYTPVDSLKPGSGYWVKANSDGIISLDPHQATSVEKFSFIPNHIVVTFKISDQKNKHQVLYLVNGDSTPAMYELPPLPPLGEFDVRFSSNRYVETYHNFFNEPTNLHIKVQSSQYPLSIKAVINKPDIQLMLTELQNGQKIYKHTMLNGLPIVINNPYVDEFQITISEVNDNPSQFILEQNYPNPWNPSTVIKYTLPEYAFVSISLTDILGRVIASIINTTQEAGEYRNIINAEELKLTSGVYYYTCNIVGLNSKMQYRGTKKFIFLK